MITIALFNNKGGVGKTTLAYHLAHMFPRLGYRVLAVDLGLSRFEDKLSESWPKGFANDQAALRATSAFHRMIQLAGRVVGADVVLVDVGPNLGAINRAALLAADYLLVPLAADLFSLQGLKNLGPTVRESRARWRDMRAMAKVNFELPSGEMRPLGYVMLQHAMRADRPAKWYEKWLRRVPEVYCTAVLGEGNQGVLPGEDHCLATLRNYRSLMPMAQSEVTLSWCASASRTSAT